METIEEYPIQHIDIKEQPKDANHINNMNFQSEHMEQTENLPYVTHNRLLIEIIIFFPIPIF